MRSRALTLLVILLSTTSVAGVPGTLQTPQPGTWAAAASYLWPGPTALADLPEGGRNLSVMSPNGKLRIIVDDTQLQVVSEKSGIRLSRDFIGVMSLAEVLWAPDSSAFFLTQSDGGWVGNWSVMVYRVTPGGLSKSPVGVVALADFRRKFPRCPDEYPNVAGIGWSNVSKRLLLVVEMPCHSGCVDMCKRLGYVVESFSGSIFESVSANDLKIRWKTMLGPRLLGKQ
jgi:hypothetical protein